MRRLNGTDFSYNLFITCEEKELNIRKNNESNRVRSPGGEVGEQFIEHEKKSVIATYYGDILCRYGAESRDIETACLAILFASIYI